MRNIGLNIRTMRMSRGMNQTELASKIGVSRSAVGMWENNEREPDLDTLEALADEFNVPLSSLVGKLSGFGSAEFCSTAPDAPVRIPILGTIPAGIPLEAIEDIVDWEEIPASMARGGKEYFGLKVTGDSMSPRYEDGDVLILRKQDSCESGQDCAVMVGNSDATFKRVRFGPSGVTLHPLNPNYETYHYTNLEVVNLPVRILGVVVEMRRKI